MRRGGTGYAQVGRRRGLGVASWALSPQAVEAIRAQMLQRVISRDEILAQRDAIFPALFAAVAMMVVVSFFTPAPTAEQLARFSD